MAARLMKHGIEVIVYDVSEERVIELSSEEAAPSYKRQGLATWLPELTSNALQNDPHLDKLKGYVDDSGEGKWTIEAALEFNVPANVISTALFNRFLLRHGRIKKPVRRSPG